MPGDRLTLAIGIGGQEDFRCIFGSRLQILDRGFLARDRDVFRLEGILDIDAERALRDRKSTRLNSSHDQISYAVFCLKKKKNKQEEMRFTGFERGCALFPGAVQIPTSHRHALTNDEQQRSIQHATFDTGKGVVVVAAS